jgi:transcriptional regulator with GAF, ATPase, and Fis domain
MYAETPTQSFAAGFASTTLERRPAEASLAAPAQTLQHGHHELIGSSPRFLAVTKKIPLLAGCDATVLITGETGTGKELVAEAVHRMSDRASKPFIPLNCGALPDDLIENELFGHAKGAYTGAATHGRGLLAEAEGGTLFLDELNSLSLSAQAKLLRFLQNREFRMLGSTKIQHADVRIIAATNVDLRDLVRSGHFREDLYHRLFVLALELPPLRERSEDIAILAEHFLAVFAAASGRGSVELSRAAHGKLRAYSWPGNVRELKSVMQRSVLLSRGDRLDCDDIDLLDMPESFAAREETPAYGEFEVEDDALTSETFRDAKDRIIREFEKAYLSRVLAEADGNVTHAAKIAGMQRRDLQRLLRKHDLRREDLAAA